MICSNCKAPLDSEDQFCSSCGQKNGGSAKKSVSVPEIFTFRFYRSKLFYVFLGILATISLYFVTGFQWKIQEIRVNRSEITPDLGGKDYPFTIIGDEWSEEGPDFKKLDEFAAITPSSGRNNEANNQVITVVRDQLSSLKDNNLSKAYQDYTSAEFKQATPFTSFEEFINSYPIFTKHATVNFSDVFFENNKASVTAILEMESLANPIDYTLIKTGDQWKIFGLRVLSPEQTVLSSTDKGDIIATVTDQLVAFKTNNLSKAYDDTTKEFRVNTSLQSFEEFVKANPILHEYLTSSYSQILFDHQTALLTVMLVGDNSKADIEYRLIKEEDRWKIWSINITRNISTTSRPPSIKSADLLLIIENQLEAIRNNDIKKGYQDYTSNSFKEATSFSDFEAFVHKNLVIEKNKGSNFTNFNIEDEVGTLEGTLSSASGEIVPVKYRLIYENNGWKILSINILYSMQTSTKKDQALEFSKIQIGTEVDLRGIVRNPITELKSAEQDKITANIYVHNGSKGVRIEAILEHVNSASKTTPVFTTLDHDGDSIISFVFTPPTQGWPKGEYKLHITASMGSKTDFSFQVK